MKCPKCGSDKVDEDSSNDSVLGLLLLHVYAPLGLSEHEFECKECNHRWKE